MPAITADYSSSFPSVIFVKKEKKKSVFVRFGLVFLFLFFFPFLNGRNNSACSF